MTNAELVYIGYAGQPTPMVIYVGPQKYEELLQKWELKRHVATVLRQRGCMETCFLSSGN